MKQDLELQIQAYEAKFGLSSVELRRKIAQGEREESWEVCKWLMLLDLRDLIESKSKENSLRR